MASGPWDQLKSAMPVLQSQAVNLDTVSHMTLSSLVTAQGKQLTRRLLA